MTCSPSGELIFEGYTYGSYPTPTGFTFGVDCHETTEKPNE